MKFKLTLASIFLLIAASAVVHGQSPDTKGEKQVLIHVNLSMFSVGGSTELLFKPQEESGKKFIKGIRGSYGYYPMNIAGYYSLQYLLIDNPLSKGHLEYGLGPCIFTDKTDRERFPPIAAHVVYRYQKPEGRAALRFGMGFPDLLLTGGIGIRLN